MGGLLIIGVVAVLAFVLGALDASTYLALGRAGGCRHPRRLRRLPERKNRRGHQRTPEVPVAARGRDRRGNYIQSHFDITGIRVPFVGDVIIGAIPYIVFAVIAIVGASNGVNLTDGLDGLAGGTLIFAFVAFMIIALLNVPHQPNLALVCALVIGATLGFLWFNVHPAQVFMGDSGALSLGATLAVTALITGQILVLPIIGLIFVVETASVIIQRAYYRRPAASGSSG